MLSTSIKPKYLTTKVPVFIRVVPAVVSAVALPLLVDTAAISTGELVGRTGATELVLAVGTLADAVALGRAGAVVAAGHLVRPTLCGESRSLL